MLMYDGASDSAVKVGRVLPKWALFCGSRAEPVRSRYDSMASAAMAVIVSWSSHVDSA